MNIDKPQAPKAQGEQKQENHFKWLHEHFHMLGQDLKTEIRKAKFWLEVLGLAGLLYYACLTRGLLKEAQKTATEAVRANNTAQQTLQLQNHPWVGITENAVIVEESKSPRGWTVSYTAQDYGQSPARRVIHRTVQIEAINRYSFPHDTDIHVMCPEEDKIASDETKPATTIFPGTKFEFSDFVPFRGQKGWLRTCIVYHDVWGGKYDTAIIYSIEQRKIVNIETSQ